MPPKQEPFIYVFETHDKFKQDRNGDCNVNELDDQVVRYWFNAKTKKYDIIKNPGNDIKFINRPENKASVNKIKQIIADDDGKDPQRVVYSRVQHNDPAPVIIKDQTDLVQYVKQGAGFELGKLAVDGVANVLGDMFSQIKILLLLIWEPRQLYV